jgi:hypothetical protein
MTFGLWRAGSGSNGDARKLQPPRREADEPGSDYRYHRHHYRGGNGSGGDGRSPVVTAAMVSLAIGAIMLAAYWLGFQRTEIDRALAPLRENIGALQSAHGRLDDRVTSEVLRLNREKVDIATQADRREEFNRRTAAIERAMEQATEHGIIALQQYNELSERLEELRQRLRDVEQELDNTNLPKGGAR